MVIISEKKSEVEMSMSPKIIARDLLLQVIELYPPPKDTALSDFNFADPTILNDYHLK